MTAALALATGGGAVSLLTGFGRPRQTGKLLHSDLPLPPRFEVPLPHLPVARPDRPGHYLLTQTERDVEILPGRSSRIWGYDGRFPGPTIHADRDRRVTVTVRNELPVPTVTHLHGGHTAPAYDGYPTDLVLPAGFDPAGRMTGRTARTERDHVYELDQRAATLWYHDHTMDFTGPNVYRGLAGMFVVRDREERALPLPDGDRDVELVVCDRAFDADAQLHYPALSQEQHHPGVEDAYAGGVLGDVVLVNGAPWPVMEVSTVRYRLRFLNASNARRYDLRPDPEPADGAAFVQVGTDGGLLAAPYPRDSLTLAPAERADVVLDFSGYPVGTTVVLRNTFGSGSTSEVMAFRVTRREPDDSAVPEVLSEPGFLSRADAVQTREFVFQLRRPTGSATAGHGQDASLVWMVNGRPFDPAYDEATPREGDVEVWRFLTDVHHPVHVHLTHFQVLARNGRSAPDSDQGWKDTVDLIPGESCEVLVRFTGHRGRTVLHCHNLEHEDMAMMANVRVT